MPTPVGHALAGAAVCFALEPPATPGASRNVAAAVIFALLADADFIVSPLIGTATTFHHAATHSIGATAIIGLLLAAATRVWPQRIDRRLALILTLAYASHLGLDYLSADTSFPYGIELWWPFSPRYAISPIQIFADIHRGSPADLVGRHNGLAALREIAILVPVVTVIWWGRRAKRKRRTGSKPRA